MAMISTLCRALAPAALVAASVVAAHAQPSPNCTRLEAQLAAFDRGGADPSRADQARRYEEAVAKQQGELDQQLALAQRSGCGRNSFFVLFSGEPAQCGPINAKIQQMRDNLETMRSDLARLQGGGANDGQRRAILVALAQNNCGQQYNAALTAAAPPQQRGGGLFETLFGPSAGPGGVITPGGADAPQWSVPGGSYKTVCVRTCDGYYYPISFATQPNRFQEDEKACQKSCPATEVMLFAHRNPGEDISQAMSTNGQLYSSLPNAYKYRQAFDNACSCRAPGESWAKALRNADDNNTVERGDIIVNDQRARQLSAPRVDAQGKPIAPLPPVRTPARLEPKPDAAKPAEAAKADEPAAKPDPNRPVRAVGPTFLPAR